MAKTEWTEEEVEWVGHLYERQYGASTSFAALLFDLIGKADAGNRVRIRKGFPDAVAVWEAWYTHPSEDAFFKSHGFSR